MDPTAASSSQATNIEAQVAAGVLAPYQSVSASAEAGVQSMQPTVLISPGILQPTLQPVLPILINKKPCQACRASENEVFLSLFLLAVDGANLSFITRCESLNIPGVLTCRFCHSRGVMCIKRGRPPKTPKSTALIPNENYPAQEGPSVGPVRRNRETSRTASGNTAPYYVPSLMNPPETVPSRRNRATVRTASSNAAPYCVPSLMNPPTTVPNPPSHRASLFPIPIPQPVAPTPLFYPLPPQPIFPVPTSGVLYSALFHSCALKREELPFCDTQQPFLSQADTTHKSTTQVQYLSYSDSEMIASIFQSSKTVRCSAPSWAPLYYPHNWTASSTSLKDLACTQVEVVSFMCSTEHPKVPIEFPTPLSAPKYSRSRWIASILTEDLGIESDEDISHTSDTEYQDTPDEANIPPLPRGSMEISLYLRQTLFPHPATVECPSFPSSSRPLVEGNPGMMVGEKQEDDEAAALVLSPFSAAYDALLQPDSVWPLRSPGAEWEEMFLSEMLAEYVLEPCERTQ